MRGIVKEIGWFVSRCFTVTKYCRRAEQPHDRSTYRPLGDGIRHRPCAEKSRGAASAGAPSGEGKWTTNIRAKGHHMKRIHKIAAVAASTALALGLRRVASAAPPAGAGTGGKPTGVAGQQAGIGTLQSLGLRRPSPPTASKSPVWESPASKPCSNCTAPIRPCSRRAASRSWLGARRLPPRGAMGSERWLIPPVVRGAADPAAVAPYRRRRS